MNARGRLTITDVIWYFVGLVVLASLAPVALSLMERNAGVIPGNTMMLLQSILPMALVVLLATIFLKARVGTIGGGGR